MSGVPSLSQCMLVCMGAPTSLVLKHSSETPDRLSFPSGPCRRGISSRQAPTRSANQEGLCLYVTSSLR